MLVIVCIYTYQFDDIRELWLNTTRLTERQLVFTRTQKCKHDLQSISQLIKFNICIERFNESRLL